MSANPKAVLHPLFAQITKPLSDPDPMAPLKKLYEDSLEQIAAERWSKRMNVQRMVESQIVEQRPDFLEATEILDALRAGLEAKLESDNYDLPLEVGYAFDDLKKAMDKAMPYEPDAYDPQDQYAGPEAEERE